MDLRLRPHALITWVLVAMPLVAWQAPVFRGGIDVVTLDVSVLDRDRRPVRGLTTADFVVQEDGEERPIVSFLAVDLADGPLRLPTRWLSEVAPDVDTNGARQDRLIVIVMDDALLPHDPRIASDARSIGQTIVKLLEPPDVAAVVFSADGRKAQDFTRDRARLRKAVDSFGAGFASWQLGHSRDGRQTTDTDGQYYLGSLKTLISVTESVASVSDVRKIVFWISPGLPLDTNTDQMPVPNRELAERLHQQRADLYRRAQMANVTIYPVDPTGLGGLEAFLTSRTQVPHEAVARAATIAGDFLRTTADHTGGLVVTPTPDYGHALGRILQENRAYYVIGFTPRSGSGHRRIDVAVRQPGMWVRAPTGLEHRDTTRGGDITAQGTRALGAALGGLLPNRGIPLRVTTASFAARDNTKNPVAIVLGVDLTRQVEDSSVQPITTDLQIGVFSPDGEMRSTERRQARVVPRLGSGNLVYEVLSRVELPPGRYQLRLAAHTPSTGQSGSVFTDVTVPDFGRLGWSASGLVLSAARSIPSAPREVVAGFLPVVPTAARQFDRTDRIELFLRLYQRGRKEPASVDLTMSVTDRYGGVTMRDAWRVDHSAFLDAGGDAWQSADIRRPVSLSGLESGEHLLTITAAEPAALERHLRFVVR